MAAYKVTKTMTFEKAIARLEEIAVILEGGKEGLESSIALYEEGTALATFCDKSLVKAKQKIIELSDIKNDGVENSEL